MKSSSRFKIPSILIPVILVATLLDIKNADAAVYYVAKTGSDSNNCTAAKNPSTPKLTVNAGIACMVGGDTLMVGAGTYNEGIGQMGGSGIPSGSASAYTKIIGNNGVRGTVFLAPDISSPYSQAIHITSGSYIEFNGIGSDGVNWTPTNWQTSGYPGCCGISVQGDETTDPGGVLVHDIHWLNAEAKNNKCGSSSSQYDTNVVFSGNYIHGDTCQIFSHGFYIGGGTNNNIISSNVVDGMAANGMQVYSGHPEIPLNNVVYDNIFRNNGFSYGDGDGISGGGTGTLMYNNLTYGNKSYGIRIAYSAPSNDKAYNNTVYGNGIAGLYIGPAVEYADIENNIIYANGTDYSIDPNSAGSKFANNLCQGSGTGCAFNGNPNFLNASTSDFHLTSGSTLAIDNGVTLPSVTTDFDGNVRPQGSAYDIGAYEYGVLVAPSNLRIAP